MDELVVLVYPQEGPDFPLHVQAWHVMEGYPVELQGVGVEVELPRDDGLEVLDVPLLGGLGDADLLHRHPLGAKEVHGLLGRLAEPRIQEIRADDRPRPALPALAVNGHHIVGGRPQPRVN